MLPLGPPDEHGSPYFSASAFAASPPLLADRRARVTTAELDEFVARHASWASEWAAFAGPGALADQVRFEREWGALRAYAARKRVRLIGDVPIYVAPGGADHVAHPELFRRDAVAGVPPDAFSATGQLWGNPLYDWPVHRATGYRWWTDRLRRTLELFDLTRLDHFRGFVAYWAVPRRHKTAKRGRWVRGPGAEPFRAAQRELGPLPVIAEDLGVITPPVERLRDELGFPGMVVLHWAFDDPRSPHAPQNHGARQVVYTSTHDTDTTVGWARATGHFADDPEPSWTLIRIAMESRARLAILPARDVLGLGSEARMNMPGRADGNWSWRLRRGQLTEGLAARLRDQTRRGRRLS